MSEEDVVKKVGDLMSTLDEVKKYRELSYAMVEFVAIFAASLIIVIAINLIQNGYDIAYGWTSSGFPMTLIGGMPTNLLLVFGSIFIPIVGLLGGYLWVSRRLRLTKVGEWREALDEGVPGAVKLLSGMDWDSVLSLVRGSRTAYLSYELAKIVGYSVLAYFLLSVLNIFTGMLPLDLSSEGYILFLSIVAVLLLSRKGLAEGFKRLRSLDLLFWDLRVFSTEFKRAEFNKA